MKQKYPSIALIAVFFESILVLITILHWYFILDEHTRAMIRMPEVNEILFGIIAAFGLFATILICIQVFLDSPWSGLSDFMHNIIYPLVDNLSFSSALILSVAAGIGEELFFREVVQPYCGIILTGIIFGVAHFLSEIPRFPFITGLYCIVGIFFALLYEITNSLWVPLIAHCLYDYLAIVQIKFSRKSQLN